MRGVRRSEFGVRSPAFGLPRRPRVRIVAGVSTRSSILVWAAAAGLAACTAAAEGKAGGGDWLPLTGPTAHAEWTIRATNGFTEEHWWARDNELICRGAGDADLVSVRAFADFDLVFEFRLEPATASGMQYLVAEPGTNGPVAALEYQVADDEGVPDCRLGHRGNRSLGALYDLVPPAATKSAKTMGDWNEGRIVVRGRHVEHWLNGQKLLEYERGTDVFRALAGGSRFRDSPAFGEDPKGHLVLRDKGRRIAYRNIRIATLAGDARAP